MLVLAPFISTPVSALTKGQLQFYAENNIIYYDPTPCIPRPANGASSSESSGTLSASGSGYSRLQAAVKTYGQRAMEMQREYGTPWEVVFAQMQMESSVGTAGVAVNGATNNWLGITGRGDAGSYSSGHHTYAVYSSVDGSIEDWAGRRVLRNGYYDAAFAHLDPNNYNLQAFVESMIAVYAPASDGNDVPAYVSSVMSFINGPIRAAREEMGWPSSAELAQQENIPIGGRNPLGSAVGSPSGSISSSSATDASGLPYCDGEGSSTGGNGDINRTAIELSWPERGHSPNDPNEAYRTALHSENGVATRGEGDNCSIGGNSCDAFLASVMRYSGVDPNFPCCGAASQLNYLSSHPELYEEIPNTGDASNLQPGDIRASTHHVEIYVVLEDGTGRIASASHCDRTADHGIGFYPNSEMHVFRYKGTAKSS